MVREARVIETGEAVWRRRHVLDLDDFSRQEIELVLDTADAMREVLSREVKRVPTLRGTTVVTLFYEASTRTRASFELAARALGADVISIAAAQASIQKGETLLDTARTFKAMGADILILRHASSGAPYLVARHVDISVINGGDGWHAHPTQALLDIYTIRQHLGSLEGKKIVIVGDITHSRVARSGIWGFTKMGAQVTVCGPPTLLPLELREALPVQVETELERALEDADVVMALRLQRERQEAGLLPSLREYIHLYQIDEERLKRARPGALLMHPGPVNEGIELSPQAALGAQSVIQEQVTNGVAIRMALLYLLAGKHEG